MTQEEKELLLKDLCARLPYNVKGLINGWEGIIRPHDIEDFQKELRTIKPYLRPMSSMTEEEKEELRILKWTKLEHHTVDWLNAYHFDYRGLIPMGLALEAKEEVYNM